MKTVYVMETRKLSECSRHCISDGIMDGQELISSTPVVQAAKETLT